MVTRVTVDDCLKYCVDFLDCVGVDVNWNLTPIQCWPHTNVNDYIESNIYSQPYTDSYQLITRCAATGIIHFLSSETNSAFYPQRDG